VVSEQGGHICPQSSSEIEVSRVFREEDELIRDDVTTDLFIYVMTSGRICS
jgi:hypothetical protein